MKEFEDQCPLLAPSPRQLLNERATRREKNLGRHIESASASLRKLGEDLEQATGKRKRVVAAAALRRATSELRQEIISAAETEVSDGVLEFANCLLSTQGRLAVHAHLLRDYTARLVREIRERLGTSKLFQSEPLLPWQRDPIAQSGIHTCEEMLMERQAVENPNESIALPMGKGPTASAGGSSRTWPAVVQKWEALKAGGEDGVEQYEHIPETDLRKLVAGQCGVKPGEVTADQIDEVAVELCHHYGRFRIVPGVLHGELEETEADRSVDLVEDEAFWKDREDEFRKYDTGQNAELFARWFSLDDHWVFGTEPGVKSPSAETLHLFKSLASLAAKGLGGERSAEPWVDWLHLLRRAKDDRTGKRVFTTVKELESSVRERELDQGRSEGKPIPAGGLVEYVEVDDDWSAAGGLAPSEGAHGSRLVLKQMHWDSTVETIERLFNSSANYCLELRSLAPRRRPDEAGAQRRVASSVQGHAEGATAILPELSESAQRMLKIQFDTHRDFHHLNGEHFEWHAKERKRLIGVPGARKWRGRDGVWHVDERLVDDTGIIPSVAMAKNRFGDLVNEFWRHWSSNAGWETFAAWLDILKQQTMAELASIWKGKSREIDSWYDRACAPAVEAALASKVKEFMGWARNAELKALERANYDEFLEDAERTLDSKIASEKLGVPAGTTIPTEGTVTQPEILGHKLVDETTLITEEHSPAPAPPVETENVKHADVIVAERRKLLSEYKDKGRAVGIRITDEMVAKAAKPGNWNDRTMVSWWKRNDPRCMLLHDKKLRAVLARDPLTIWSPKIGRNRERK